MVAATMARLGLVLTVMGASATSASAQEQIELSLDSPRFASLSPDGARASVGGDQSAVVIELATGRVIDRWDGECCVTGLAWVGGIDVLIARRGAASSGGLQIFRPGIHQPPSTLSHAPCTAVSAAGTLAAASCGDGLVLVGVEEGAGSIVAYGGLGYFTDIAITPDGGMVIAAHREVSGPTVGPTDSSDSIVGDPAAALFLEVASDWPVDPPAAYGEMQLDADIRHLAPAPGGAVATLADGTVARLTAGDFTIIAPEIALPGSEALRVLPDGRHAVGSLKGGNVLDLESGQVLDGPIASPSPGTGAWAVAGISVGAVVIWAGEGLEGPVLMVWTLAEGLGAD
jgi:hypothetical protein